MITAEGVSWYPDTPGMATWGAETRTAAVGGLQELVWSLDRAGPPDSGEAGLPTAGCGKGRAAFPVQAPGKARRRLML